MADAVHPEQHPVIGQAKDAAAAGVLLAAATAMAVGLMVFIPAMLV
ncbi:MAG: diacylglycerol kinase [Planctomycetaceae bacterium]